MEKQRILVVDDKTENISAAKEAFASEEYEATFYTTYQEAMAQLEKKDFDYVLTDMCMPASGNLKEKTKKLHKLYSQFHINGKLSSTKETVDFIKECKLSEEKKVDVCEKISRGVGVSCFQSAMRVISDEFKGFYMCNNFDLNLELPAGYFIMEKALEKNIPVAIVTTQNSHHDKNNGWIIDIIHSEFGEEPYLQSRDRRNKKNTFLLKTDSVKTLELEWLYSLFDLFDKIKK